MLQFLFCNIIVTRDALFLKYQSELNPIGELAQTQSLAILRPGETTPLCLYVERNALQAKLVKYAQDWRREGYLSLGSIK